MDTQTALPIARYLRQIQEGSRITVGAWEDEAAFVRYSHRSLANPAVGADRPEAYVWVDTSGAINLPLGGLAVLTVDEARRLGDLLLLASMTARRVLAAGGFLFPEADEASRRRRPFATPPAAEAAPPAADLAAQAAGLTKAEAGTLLLIQAQPGIGGREIPAVRAGRANLRTFYQQGLISAGPGHPGWAITELGARVLLAWETRGAAGVRA